MNKRQINKQKKIALNEISNNNNKIINNILNKINYKVINKNFVNGYGLYYFEESGICSFKLKELPNWKFGLWLNLNDKTKYKIFGEYELLIDKFKPNSSYISLECIEEFNKEIFLILNKDEKHFSYFKEIEKEIEKILLKRKYLKPMLIGINNYIEEYNKESVNKKLIFKDGGKYTSPRYTIFFKNMIKNEFNKNSLKEEMEIYMDLSKEKEKIYNEETEMKIYMDSFLIRFENFWAYLYSEKEFEDNIKKYKWNFVDLQSYLTR